MKRYKNITKIIVAVVALVTGLFSYGVWGNKPDAVTNMYTKAQTSQVTVSQETPIQSETYSYNNQEYMPQHVFTVDAEDVSIKVTYVFYEKVSDGVLNPIGQLVKTMPSNTVEFTGLRPKNVGEYQVSVTATAEGYTSLEANYTINIQKAEESIVVNLPEQAQNKTYTGEEIALNTIFTYTLPETATETDVVCSIYYNNTPVSQIKDAGSYRLEFTSKNFLLKTPNGEPTSTITYSFEVTQANATIEVIAPDTLVYANAAYDIASLFTVRGIKNENLLLQTTVTVAFSNEMAGNFQYVATYSVANQTWVWHEGFEAGSVVTAPMLQAGTHNITIELKNNKNYQYTSVGHKIIVSPKEVDLQASEENFYDEAFQFAYTGSAQNLLACIGNLQEIYASDYNKIQFVITNETGTVNAVQDIGTYHVSVVLNSNYTTTQTLEFNVQVFQLAVDTSIFENYENVIFTSNTTYNNQSHFTPTDALVTDAYGRSYAVRFRFEIQQLQKQTDGSTSYVVINTVTFDANIGGYVYATKTLPVQAGTYKIVVTYDKVANAHLQASASLANNAQEFILVIEPYQVSVFFENYQNFVEHSGQQIVAYYYDFFGNKVDCNIQYTPNMLVLTAGKYTATAVIEDTNYIAKGNASIQFIVLPATNHLTTGAIIGIVVACLAVVAIVVVVIIWAVRRKKRGTQKDAKDVVVQTKPQDVAIVPPSMEDAHAGGPIEPVVPTPKPQQEEVSPVIEKKTPDITTNSAVEAKPEETIHEIAELNKGVVEKPRAKRGRPKKVATTDIATEVVEKPKTKKRTTKKSTKPKKKSSTRKTSSKRTTKRTKKETTDEILKDIRSLLQEQSKKRKKNKKST